MTQNAKFEHDVRERMAATGQKHTQAARHVAATRLGSASTVSREPADEPHYAFTPPGTIEFVDRDAGGS